MIHFMKNISLLGAGKFSSFYFLAAAIVPDSPPHKLPHGHARFPVCVQRS